MATGSPRKYAFFCTLSVLLLAGCLGEGSRPDQGQRIRQYIPEMRTGVMKPEFDTSAALMARQFATGVRVRGRPNFRRLGMAKSSEGTAGQGWNGLFRSEETIEVYPTGLSLQDIPDEQRCPEAGAGCIPSDAQLVQAAINDLGERGVNGTVLLRARNLAGVPTSFNFGRSYPRERVCIIDTDVWLYGCLTLPSPAQSGDLELRGEILPTGERTTIAGGHSPIFFGRASRFVARDLRLENPWISGILIAKQTGSLVRSNEIIRTEHGGSPAIGVTAIYGGEASYITGHAVIEDNLIDDTPSIYHTGPAIRTLNTHVTAEIRNNTVVNSARGIIVMYYRGDHTVTDNTIITRNHPYWGWSEAGSVNCGRDPDATVSYTSNTIVAEGDGISVIAQASKGDEGPSMPCPVQNSRFNDNNIVMLNADGSSSPNAAFWLASNVFGDGETDPDFVGRILNNRFNNNTISGSAEFAFWSGSYDLDGLFGFALKEEITGNEWKNNDLSAFTLASEQSYGPANADVYFSSTSRGNAVEGCEGEIVSQEVAGSNSVELNACE